MKTIINTLMLSLLLGFSSISNAANLQKVANFHTIYAQQGQQGDSEETRSISEFITDVYDLSSEEKYLASIAYLQSRKLNTGQFLNLIQALLIAGIEDAHSDAVIGIYVATRKGRFSEDYFNTLMDLFSKDAFSAADEGANWPFQLLNQFIEYRFLPVKKLGRLALRFKKLGIPTKLIDQDLFLKFIHIRGGRIEPSQVGYLLKYLNKGESSVQPAAEIVSAYIRVNAKKLTQPKFRAEVEKLLKKVPQSAGAGQIQTLSEAARDLLFWAETEYFQPWWNKDLLINLSTLINEWNHSLTSESKTIAEAFLKRNQHRLSQRAIERIQSSFEL
ncbi:hypothetical protein HOF92_04920 [bacterium]|nr:hypothetical protein [bacterium]